MSLPDYIEKLGTYAVKNPWKTAMAVATPLNPALGAIGVSTAAAEKWGPKPEMKRFVGSTAPLPMRERAPGWEDLVPKEEPGAGGQLIPGGWQGDKQGIQVEGALDIPPEVMEQQNKAAALRERSALTTAAAKTGEAQAMAEHAENRVPIEKQAHEQSSRLNEAKNAAVGQTRQMIEDLQDQVAESKVDPRKLFHDMNFGERLLHGFKAALSGVAGSLKGTGGNRYLDNFERAEEASAAEQLRQINAKGKRAEQLQNSMDGLVKLFGDEQQALLAHKGLALTALEAELERTKAGVQGVLAKANYDQALADIAERKANVMLELAKLQQGKVTESYQEKYRSAQMVGGGAGGKGPDAARLTAVGDKYTASGLADTEAALTLLGEAYGMDGGLFASMAQYYPGQIKQWLAKATLKDPAKLQMAAAAGTIATHKFTGAAMPPDERANVLRGFSTSNPEDLATTAGILGRVFKTQEDVLGSSNPDVYPYFARNRKMAKKLRPTVSPPARTPPVAVAGARGAR